MTRRFLTWLGSLRVDELDVGFIAIVLFFACAAVFLILVRVL